MGFLSRRPSRAPAHRSTFKFPSTRAARSFISAARALPTDRGLAFAEQWPALAADHGGSLVRSTTARELSVYGFLRRIEHRDRLYLTTRDPTGEMLVGQASRDLCSSLPLTHIPALDAYFSTLLRLNLPRAHATAQRLAFRDGGAMLYLEATGFPSSPLTPADTPLRFRAIPLSRLLLAEDNPALSPLYATTPSPLTSDHDFEELSVYLTPLDKTNSNSTRIHGSRLFAIPGNPASESWLGPSLLDSIHDDLWSLRDILWAHSNRHFRDSPVVVEADLSADANAIISWETFDEDELAAQEDEIETQFRMVRSGHRDHVFLKGYKASRIDPSDLNDPKSVLMALSSRISQPWPYTPKQILASTQGNVDVGNLDALQYAANIDRLYELLVYPVHQKLVTIGRLLRLVPARQSRLPAPLALERAPIRPLDPRESAFVLKTNMAVTRQAWEIGLQPPPRVRRHFTPDPNAPSPLPAYALKGLNEDGTSADPSPSARDAALTSAIEAEVEAWMQEPIE